MPSRRISQTPLTPRQPQIWGLELLLAPQPWHGGGWGCSLWDAFGLLLLVLSGGHTQLFWGAGRGQCGRCHHCHPVQLAPSRHISEAPRE